VPVIVASPRRTVNCPASLGGDVGLLASDPAGLLGAVMRTRAVAVAEGPPMQEFIRPL
jgi:hypothetical protein